MKVIKNTTIYFVTSIFQSFLSFLLLPIYSYYLTQGEFGTASVANSIFGFLGIFYTFGFSGVIGRLYFDYNDDKEKLKRFLGTVFIFNILWNLLLSILLLLTKDLLFPVIAKGIPIFPYAYIVIAIAFFLTPFEIYQTLQINRQKGSSFGIMQVIYLLLNNGITVALIAGFGMKSVGVILGTLIANVIMFIVLIFLLAKESKFTIDKEILGKCLSYAWPIFFHALFNFGLASANALIVNNQLSVEDAGMFKIGFTIGGIASMVTVALNRAFAPWFFEELKKEKSSYAEIVDFARFIVIAYGIIALCISFFAPEAISLLTHGKFVTSWKIVPFVAYAYVFQGIYFFFLNILYFDKKNVGVVPLLTLVGAIVNISLNFILVKYLGLIGSGIATLIAMFVLSIIVYFRSKRAKNIGYSIIKMYLPALIMFPISLLIFVLPSYGLIVDIFIKLMIILLVFILMLFMYKRIFQQKIFKILFKIKDFVFQNKISSTQNVRV